MTAAKKTEPIRRPNWTEISEKKDSGIHLRKSSPEGYATWVSQIRLMSEGQDLGQVEPWWPLTLREMHYPGWANGDFETLLSLLGEGTRLRDTRTAAVRFEEEE